MDFLMKLSSFLEPGNAFPNASENILAKNEAEIKKRKTSVQVEQDRKKKITLKLHIHEYDIILVEKMDDANCFALILNVS